MASSGMIDGIVVAVISSIVDTSEASVVNVVINGVVVFFVFLVLVVNVGEVVVMGSGKVRAVEVKAGVVKAVVVNIGVVIGIVDGGAMVVRLLGVVTFISMFICYISS